MVYAVNVKHVEIFMGTKKKTSLKFKLAHNLSVRISQSSKAQIKKKQIKKFCWMFSILLERKDRASIIW